VNSNERPLFLFNSVELSTPPMSVQARREAGYLLGLLQSGEALGMPQARPMPSIGPRVYELRVREADLNWRILYRLDTDWVLTDRVLLIHQFVKRTEATPRAVIALCQTRLREYDAARAEEEAAEAGGRAAEKSVDGRKP